MLKKKTKIPNWICGCSRNCRRADSTPGPRGWRCPELSQDWSRTPCAGLRITHGLEVPSPCFLPAAHPGAFGGSSAAPAKDEEGPFPSKRQSWPAPVSQRAGAISVSPRSCSNSGASGDHSAGLRLVPCSRSGSRGPRVAIACSDWPKGVTCKGGGGGEWTRQHLRPVPARGTVPKAPPAGKVHARGSLGE